MKSKQKYQQQEFIKHWTLRLLECFYHLLLGVFKYLRDVHLCGLLRFDNDIHVFFRRR